MLKASHNVNPFSHFKNSKLYGVYFLHNNAIMIKDPELAKTVMVKDFEYFVDRNSAGTKKLFDGPYDKAWGQQMTNLSGDHWKNVRSTFTPIFTSGKMKGMVKFIQHTTALLDEEFERKLKYAFFLECTNIGCKHSFISDLVKTLS
jgi:cytochrome P450 family 9